jgi:phosphoenolpyruvate synthase/pyruvate phosphate dikinase
MTKKNTRGGARENSGRKKKFGGNSFTIALRVPEEYKEEIKALFLKILEKYKKH